MAVIEISTNTLTWEEKFVNDFFDNSIDFT